MTCSYCGSRGPEGELRCRRCGRKPDDTLTRGAPVARTSGALATKLEPVFVAPPETGSAPPPNLSRAVQGLLFAKRLDSKVIPFESYTVPQAPPAPAKPRTRAASATKPAARRSRPAPEGQGSLDFLPAMETKPRTLGTTVEAVIFCDAPVAPPLHRAVASAVDGSMVLIAYAAFLTVYRLLGGSFYLSKANLGMFAGMLLLIGFTYGLTFALACRETLGMKWTQLRLTTFDGFRPDLRQRLYRFIGSCLSLSTVVGMLWSLADEESLAWQDHISRTFPTPAAFDSQVFRRV